MKPKLKILIESKNDINKISEEDIYTFRKDFNKVFPRLEIKNIRLMI